MSQKKLRDHLVDYYSRESLPAERIAWLDSLGSDPVKQTGAPMALGTGSRLANVLFGLAACGAVALVGINLVRDSDRPADSAPPARVSSPAPQLPSPPTRFVSPPAGPLIQSMRPITPQPTPAPALVAVKLHSDWCPRCPITAPIFDRFVEKYADQPVLFVALDVTDETKRLQAHYLASSLGIDWAATASFQTGMIKLIDRERRVILATVTGESSVPLLEDALAIALRPDP